VPLDPGTPARNRIAANVVLLSILLFSAFIQFTVVTQTQVISPFRADAREYFFSAYNLAHYGVYSSQVTWPPEQHVQPPPADALRTPGYPIFLRLVGHPEPTVEYEGRIKLTQATLGVLSVWMMYLIAVSFLRRRWACVAALLTAISPHLAVSSTYVLTESLFFFLLLACVLALFWAIDSAKRWPFAVVGLLIGLCSLVRSTTAFMPVLALLACLAIPRLKQFRASALLVFLGCAMAVSPWLIRNAGLPPQVQQSSQMVGFLRDGSYPNFMYNNDPATFGDPYRADPQAAQIGRSVPSVLAHIAQNFRKDPIATARWYLIGKPGYFLSWADITGAGDMFVYNVASSPYLEDRRFDLIRRVAFALHWPLMLLGLVGACLPWWRPQRWGLSGARLAAARLVSLVVFYAIGFHMIGAPFPRYGVPFRPLLYPLALLALTAPWRSRAGVAGIPEPVTEAHIPESG
jgi:4-amino-4-deoxy-L-arabinose transferase-like glycosyltransferase